MGCLPDLGRRYASAAPAFLAVALLGAAWRLLPHPALVVVLGALPLAGLTVVRWPLLPILGFILFSFFRIHDIFRFLEPFKLPQLLALGSIATLAWHIVFSGSIRPFLNRELVLLALMFLAVSIGLPFATNPSHSMHVWTSTYSKIALMTFAIAWLMRHPADFAIAVRAIVLAGMVVSIKALMNKSAGIDLVEETRVTIGLAYNSPLGDPNDLALALLFPLAFCLALVSSRDCAWFWRATALLACLLAVAAILATQSRGGLLGTIAVFAACAHRFVRSKLLLAGGAAVAMVVLFVLANVADRASGGAASDGVDASAMGRLHAWQAGFWMAVSNPLTGVGIGNFVGQYFYYTPVWDGLHHAAHSTWFEMLGDAGFLAFGLLLALVACTIRRAYSLLQYFEASRAEYLVVARALAWGLAGFIVSGTFLSQAFTWPLYILIGLVSALSRAEFDHEAEHDKS